jgi:putative nucleotidyltransferase with HDIG domain
MNTSERRAPEVAGGSDGDRVLVVDDERMIRGLLTQLLEKRYQVVAVEDGHQALAVLERDPCQLALVDIQMSGMSGLELLQQITARFPDTAVVMVSGVTEVDTAVSTIRAGAYDYVLKPFSLKAVESCVERALEKRRLVLENRNYQQNLERLVSERTQELQSALGQIESTYDATIKALGAALDLRDSETEHHCIRVADFVHKLACRAGVTSEETLRDIEWGAYLHDIGKIGVPDSILLKPAKLTEEELVVIRTHPLLGYKMLSRIPFLKGAAEVVLSHHESYDGGGYPHGLKGEDIPLSARLFAVADTIDAMTSERPYRAAMPIAEVGKELRRLAGRQFDPRIVEVFSSLPTESWQA